MLTEPLEYYSDIKCCRRAGGMMMQEKQAEISEVRRGAGKTAEYSGMYTVKRKCESVNYA